MPAQRRRAGIVLGHRGAVQDQQGHEARQAKRGDAPAGRPEGKQRPRP